MMMEKEVELKYLVSKIDFLQVKKRLDMNRRNGKIIHTNYYFDTDDFFYYRNNFSVKVREISKKFFFILKQETKKVLNNRESNEFIADISAEEKEKFVLFGELPNKVRILLNKLYLKKDLRFLGCLKTIRCIYKMNGYTIFLDENFYFGKNDYEIEIERLDEESKVNLPNWMQQLLIGDCVSKYKRYVKILNEGKKGDLIRLQVSGIVTNSKNEVLLIKKNKPDSSIHNKLIPPGGHVEFGETPNFAVVRELQEETGINMQNPVLTGIVSFISKGKMEHSVCLFFKGTGEGELFKKEMHVDSYWFSLDNLEKEPSLTNYHKNIILSSLKGEKMFFFTISDEEKTK